MKRILVAGIGNIFMGDDSFGVEVVHNWRNARSRASAGSRLWHSLLRSAYA